MWTWCVARFPQKQLWLGARRGSGMKNVPSSWPEGCREFKMIMVSNFTLFLMAFTVDFLWAASVRPSQPTVTKTRIIYVGGDYDDYEDETPKPSHNSGLPRLTTARFTPQQCDYDLCVEQEVPCSVLSAQTKCYCPGLTGPEQIPEPPQLREVKEGPSGEVEVHWCAPLSTVMDYKVVAEDGGHRFFPQVSRNGTIQGLKPGSQVCVVAINGAGASEKNERSCARFEPRQTSQAALSSGIIAGCIGFLFPYGSGVAVSESVCPGRGGPKACTRGQQVEQVTSWVKWSFRMLPALLRQRELNRSSRQGSGQPMIFWAVFMTLCSALLSLFYSSCCTTSFSKHADLKSIGSPKACITSCFNKAYEEA
ncbi:hypothetical protein NFI96_005761 [Prochilodus magdalenae]|nr:hypothetical protein NFI96_005761 [Prochilodus magdalenae]